MSIIQGSAMQGASRGFYPKELTGSLRFNDDDSAYLSWTPASAGNRKTWTWSAWVKRCTLGTYQRPFQASSDSNNRTELTFFPDNTLEFFTTIGGVPKASLKTQAVFRDPSAWYHLVVVLDAVNTSLEIYVNGVLQTLTTTTAVVNTDHMVSSTNVHTLGRYNPTGASYFDGYMAEVFFIDGTAHDADAFGETKNGVWVPKNITATDFTMGTNGFHLTFEDDTEVEAFNTVIWSGDDVSGRQVTGVGFNPDLVWTKSRSSAVNHVLMDSVRGPNLRLESNTTDAEDVYDGINSFDSDGFSVGVQTGVNDVGKTYVAWCWDAGANNASTGHSSVTWEGSGSDVRVSGLPFRPDLVWAKSSSNGTSHALFDSVRGVGKMLNTNNTVAEISNSQYGYLDSFDKDGFHFQVGTSDGTYGTFSGHEYVAWAWDAGDSDAVTDTSGTNVSSVTRKTSTANGFSIIDYTVTSANNSATKSVPHGLGGNPDFMMVKKRTNNASDNQRWAVYHSALADDQFLKLGDEATDGPSTSSSVFDDSAFTTDTFAVGSSGMVGGHPSFDESYICYAWKAVSGKSAFGKYTGDGTSDGSKTINLGFRPGFFMWKRLENGYGWNIVDGSRSPFAPTDSFQLQANTSSIEGTTDLIAFTDTGVAFTETAYAGTNENNAEYMYVAFAGSYSDYITDYNTDGSIDSRVKASDTTGFSIVSYVGTGANATVGHGLSAAPDMIIVKRREAASAWEVQHSALGAVANQDISLNETTGAASGGVERWHQLPTSSVFSVGTGSNTNASGEGMIAYCWTATTGVSSFGSYTGTGSNQTINFGFRPAFFLTKSTSAGDPWVILDATRETVNDRNFVLQPNSSAVEDTDNDDVVEFTDTGVVIKSTSGWSNRSGIDYIYAAFADTREAAFWLDQSSNDNDWQPVNLDHNDTVSDSPTDNFATLNPLDAEPNLTLSDGNLRCANPADADAEMVRATIGVSSGKYYWEITCIANSAGNNFMFGIATADLSLTDYPGQDANGWGYYGANGYKFHSGSSSAYGDAYTNGDVIGVALDMDAGTLEFYKNGTSQGVAYTGISGTVFPCFADGSSSQSIEYSVNFGQQPFKYDPPE